MVLVIKQRKDVWRLQIQQEEWEFKNSNSLMTVVEDIIRKKELYGQLTEDKHDGKKF